MSTTLYRESGHENLFDPVEVSRGKIHGAYPFGGYGEKTTTGADSGVVWPDGVFVFPAAAGVQLSIVSTSANDTNTTGTGARTIEIHYLDDQLVDQVETVAVAGTTPVLTTATNVRFIQCMHVVTFGSLKATAGIITASNGGNTHSQISAGRHRCSSSVRMVPKGKRLIVNAMFGGSISGTATASTVIRIATPSFDGHDYTSSSVFMTLFSAAYQDSSAGLTIPCPIAFTEGQSVGMLFTTDKAATIVASWFGWLEDA